MSGMNFGMDESTIDQMQRQEEIVGQMTNDKSELKKVVSVALQNAGFRGSFDIRRDGRKWQIDFFDGKLSNSQCDDVKWWVSQETGIPEENITLAGLHC